MKLWKPMLFICFAMLAAAPGDRARLDFETGDFRGWMTNKLVFPHSGRVVSDPVRAGKHAARFELRPGDDTGDGVRTELKDDYLAPRGEFVWYAFSTYVPADFPVVHKATVIAQWKGSEDEGENAASRSPILAHRYDGRTLFVDIRWSEQKFQTANDGERKLLYEHRDLPRGVWHDFVYCVRWSHRDDGRVEGWMNGRKVVDHSGPVGYNDDEGPYFKFGIYQHSGNKPFVIYHDEYRRGRTREDVALR